ncbi:MAG: YqgE/AlgH family protein [Pseudomonadota bacterium]
MQDFLNGKILVAMPNMTDPRFEKSLVLVCSHDANHAMGIVANKQLDDVKTETLLEQLQIAPRSGLESSPVYFGGPVKTDRGLILHTNDYVLDATMPINDCVGLTGSQTILVDTLGAHPTRPAPLQSKFVIGHAAWGPGQLEREMAANAWVHCDFSEEIIFRSDGDAAWKAGYATLGVTEAMFSSSWSDTRTTDHPLN